MMSVYFDIQIKASYSLCFMKHLKSGKVYSQNNTCTHHYGDTSKSIIARYAMYVKFSIEPLPKLVLYQKYSTERVVLS